MTSDPAKSSPVVTVRDVLESDWPLALAKSSNGDGDDFDGACPCCVIQGDGFTVRVHCWRSQCSECKYSGIHVSGTVDATTKELLAKHVRDHNGWTDSTDWNIVID